MLCDNLLLYMREFTSTFHIFIHTMRPVIPVIGRAIGHVAAGEAGDQRLTRQMGRDGHLLSAAATRAVPATCHVMSWCACACDYGRCLSCCLASRSHDALARKRKSRHKCFSFDLLLVKCLAGSNEFSLHLKVFQIRWRYLPS